MEIERFKKYRAIVKIRRGDGFNVRPEFDSMDGLEVVVQAMWKIDDVTMYAGEWAMGAPLGIREEYRLLWIASGDLEILGEVEEP